MFIILQKFWLSLISFAWFSQTARDRWCFKYLHTRQTVELCLIHCLTMFSKVFEIEEWTFHRSSSEWKWDFIASLFLQLLDVLWGLNKLNCCIKLENVYAVIRAGFNFKCDATNPILLCHSSLYVCSIESTQSKDFCWWNNIIITLSTRHCYLIKYPQHYSLSGALLTVKSPANEHNHAGSAFAVAYPARWPLARLHSFSSHLHLARFYTIHISYLSAGLRITFPCRNQSIIQIEENCCQVFQATCFLCKFTRTFRNRRHFIFYQLLGFSLGMKLQTNNECFH